MEAFSRKGQTLFCDTQGLVSDVTGLGVRSLSHCGRNRRL